jgi:hypothetical protein
MPIRRLPVGDSTGREIAALAQRCEALLVAAARRAGTASRQQLRSAARRFVKRHRGDRAYLEWVLCRVTASAAAALALLGLAPAQAALNGGPVFDPFATNPLASADVGYRAAPAVADLDADGDLDVLSGGYGAGFRYFRNTGTATAPAYLELTGTANPANGLSASGVHSQPALADLDGDGDLDLVAGDDFVGGFTSYENIGTATAPAARPKVSLLWAPIEAGGYSLIVDAEASVSGEGEAARVLLRPTRGVLHRPAAAPGAQAPKPGCSAVCVPLTR